MNLINENVQHTKFGSGIIVNLEEDKVHVKFAEQQEEKSFIFPDAFQHFLKLENLLAEKNVIKLIHLKNEKIEAEKKLIKQGNIRREEELKEEKLELAKTKKKTAKIASATKKAAAKLL